MNLYGKESFIKLEAALKNGRTYLKNSYFSSPFKITKPFLNEDNSIKIIVMSSSPGIFENDELYTEIVMNENSKMELRTQSYNKIFKMDNGKAIQNTSIYLKKGAFFKYLPHPTIPYKASNFINNTVIYMEDEALCYYRDILSCGRYMRQEIFQFKSYASNMKVYHENKLLFYERNVLEPENQDICGIGFYEGYTHQCNFYVFGNAVNEQLKLKLMHILDKYEQVEYGITQSSKASIIIKILGNSSESLLEISDELALT